MTDAIRTITIRGTLEIDTSSLASLETSAAQRSLDELADRAKSVTDGIASAASAAAKSVASRGTDSAFRQGQRVATVTESVAEATMKATRATRERAAANRELADSLRAVGRQEAGQPLLLSDQTSRFPELQAQRRRRLEEANRLFQERRQRELAEQAIRIEREAAERRGLSVRQLRFNRARDEALFSRPRGLNGGLPLVGARFDLNEQELSRTSQLVDRTKESYDGLGRSVRDVSTRLGESRTAFVQTQQGLTAGAAAATLFAVAADDTQSALTRITASVGGVLSAGSAVTGLARGVRLLGRVSGPVGLAVGALATSVGALVKAREDNNRAIERGLELDRRLEDFQQNRIASLREENRALTDIAESRRQVANANRRGQLDVEQQVLELDRDDPGRFGKGLRDALDAAASRLDNLDRRRQENLLSRGGFGNGTRGERQQFFERGIGIERRRADELSRTAELQRDLLGNFEREGVALERAALSVAQQLEDSARFRGRDLIEQQRQIRNRGVDEDGLDNSQRRQLTNNLELLDRFGVNRQSSPQQLRELAEQFAKQRAAGTESIKQNLAGTLREAQAATEQLRLAEQGLQELLQAVKNNAESQTETTKEAVQQLEVLSRQNADMRQGLGVRSATGGVGAR